MTKKYMTNKDVSSLNYSTLDQVPEVTSIESMYKIIFEPHETSCGIAITGRVDNDADECVGYWGRSITDDSGAGELVQVRFAPNNMLSVDGRLPGTVSLIAVRVTNPICREASSVRTAILFRPGEGDIDCDMLERSVRALGASCLPVLRVGMYSRQNHDLANHDLSVDTTDYDGDYFEVLRAGSYTLMRDECFKTMSMARVAAPSLAQVVIAGEIAGVHINDTTTRLVEPIKRSHWLETKRAAVKKLELALEQTGGTKGMASDAMGAAGAICELLTADKWLEMQTSEFFDGALPSALVKPDGMGLIVAMACRLAMHPERYGLQPGSPADRAASAHAKMLFESTHAPLDIPSHESRYAMDMAIRTAIETVRTQSVRKKGSRPTCASRVLSDDFAPELVEGRMYWQRVGQHILTKLFWLGGTPGPYPEEDELSKHAWRTTDPLADARAAALKQAGCDGVGIDVSIIRFADLRDLKKAWMEMMSEVEHWLTTGEWEGRQLSPKNSQKEVERLCASKEETALDKSVDEELLRIWFDRVNDGERVNPPKSFKSMSREDKRRLFYQTHNMAAHNRAAKAISDVIVRGPRHEKCFDARSYVVAHSQTQACATCDTEVHVLQGIMADTTFGVCARCKARKCFPCTREMRNAINSGDPKRLQETKCLRCGNAPPQVPLAALTQTVGMSDADVHSYIVRAVKQFSMDPSALMP